MIGFTQNKLSQVRLKRTEITKMKILLDNSLKIIDKTLEHTFNLPEDSEVKIKIKRVLIKRLQDIVEIILKLEYFLDELEDCKCDDEIENLLKRKDR